MSATMERGLHLGLVHVQDPVLQSWVKKLRQRNPHFSYEPDPQKWIGLYAGSRLLAALAHKLCAADEILIEAIVCEPSKAGRVAVQALWLALVQNWQGKRITFFVSRINRKMLRALPVGSTEVARMYQVRM